ncbi:hypothetical protein [Duganella sp.]|uniref:hypothetical protein n=1 Tax=Duganella sp. TaxID=1904440 RepID=UPI0031E01E28
MKIDIHRLKKLGMLAICHLVLCSSVLAATQTYTRVGYNRAIKQSDFDGLSKPTVLQMQNQLKTIYSKLPDWQADYTLKEQPLSDGIVGRITLSWLQRYGYTFRLATADGYAEQMAGHVARVAAFGAAYPMELGALLSNGFADWENQQPEKVRASDAEVLRRANSQELLALFKRYDGGRAQAPRPAAVTADRGYYTYELDKDDLDLLQGKDQLMQLLGSLKDKPFHSQEEMRVGLLQALAGMQELHKSLWPIVQAQARSYDGFLINEATLDKVEKEGWLDTEALGQLRGLGTVYLQSPEAYEKYINDRVADGTVKLTDDEILKLSQTTRVFDNYHLDAQGLETIQNQLKSNVLNAGMPAAVVRMLEQLKDVNYPEASVFRSAAISKIDFGLSMCKLNSPTNNAYVAGLRISDVELDALEKQLAPLRQQSLDGVTHLTVSIEDAFKRIRTLRSKVEICDDVTDKESKDLVRDIYLSYLGSAIEGLARKKIPDQLPEIQIKGSKCGCAVDDVARIDYAFYPYWQSKKEVQPINFRVLNRVAFQTLTVDNFGNFQRGADSFDVTQNSSSETAFVRVAHQYNSKVDWVIQKNDWDGDWRNFTAQSRKVVFAKIRANIIALLTTPLNDTASRLKAFSTLGLEPKPRRGDGVTLYFPNYPVDANATAEFNTFFKELRADLDQHELGLNVLVSQNVFTAGKNGGPGAFGASNLINLRKKRAATEPNRPGGPENDEFILVLLNEPSSDAKKALRQDIESDSNLHGSDRADFLRSILPVLHFDNRNWQQLQDDIVYARDTFGGLGLWAPDFDNLAKPVEDTSLSCLKSASLTTCLSRNYLDPGEDIKLPNALEAFACVQRWILRLILAVLLLVIITTVVLFFRFCGAQNFIKRNFLYVLVLVNIPATLVFTLLLLYDPLLGRLSSGNLPFIITAVVGMAVLIAGYMYLRKRRRVPMRQRSTLVRHEMGFPIVVWRTEANEHGFQWILKNTGSGYAIIKKVEIMFDNHPFADVKAALDSVLAADTTVQWKSTPLTGQKLEPGGELLALTIADAAAAQEVEQRLNQGQLVVHIVYGGAGSEHWVSDGKEVRSISSL